MADHSFGEKFRAVLATGRVANLPTVWSNVIVAYFLANTIFPLAVQMPGKEFLLKYHYWLLLFACLGTSCLYVGGCMLGDYRDVYFDRKHRPERPLVTGVLSPPRIAFFAIILLVIGFIIGGLSTAAALIIPFKFPLSRVDFSNTAQILNLLQITPLCLLGLLVIFIVFYALIHKQSRIFALMNMSLCRIQLCLVAAALAIPLFHGTNIHGKVKLLDYFHHTWLSPLILIPACGVGLYTLLLASVAATESNKDKIKFSKLLKAVMLLLPLLAVFILALTSAKSFPLFNDLKLSFEVYSLNTLRGYFIGTLLIYGSWMIYSFSALPHDKPAFVSRALAGFCLLDSCFAATYSVTIPLVCFILFGLALLLQKVAPAT